MSSNIILAGVARSGSTLACHLLNKVTNTVALHEPILNPRVLESYSSSDKLRFIGDFFEQQRSSLLTDGRAISKSAGGKIPDNPRGEFDPDTGLRKHMLDSQHVVVEKTLTDSLTLIIKQPGLFSGMLPELVECYPCYATIRNPLSVLLSWNTVNMEVSSGRAPAAELCDPQLKRSLDDENDLYRRQLILLSWYFSRYRDSLPDEHIVRYESVIKSGGKALEIVVPEACELDEKLKSKNNNEIYNDELRAYLASLLKKSSGAYWEYYDPKEILQEQL